MSFFWGSTAPNARNTLLGPVDTFTIDPLFYNLSLFCFSSLSASPALLGLSHPSGLFPLSPSPSPDCGTSATTSPATQGLFSTQGPAVLLRALCPYTPLDPGQSN